jgi:hypothetical protein
MDTITRQNKVHGEWLVRVWDNRDRKSLRDTSCPQYWSLQWVRKRSSVGHDKQWYH